tara:strand:+ start:89 stop:340 length:252 start_codon:yes stop_codon:yes gene_type:complete
MSKGKPEVGKVYALTGGSNTPSIMNGNTWSESEVKENTSKEEMIKELRRILKVYHYDSKEQHMSKDVVTSLENLLGGMLKCIK